MKTTSKVVVGMMAVGLFAGPPLLAQQADTGSKPISHPPEVALMDEGELGAVYRQTLRSLRLYTHDSDPIGKSTCTGGCASAWPPLTAPIDATPVGDWTVVVRDDGERQWAYQGKPVYTRFHDVPNEPTGAGIDGWRILPHLSKAASSPTGPQTND